MSANMAKYLLTLAGAETQSYQVTGFVGEDAISSPYWFDIEFCMSGAALSANAAPPDAGVVGKDCRLDIEQNGEMVSYSGIAAEFRVRESDSAGYMVSLVPRMYLLTLNCSSRVFNGFRIREIIKEVVAENKLDDYFLVDDMPDRDGIKYPVREFCVQYQETDLAFISRLMEESGIWYCFADKKQPDGTHREYAVVTDDFSKYPMLGRAIPFKKGSGTAEITSAGKIIESINSLSVRAALAPQNVRVRSYSHHVPEPPP